MTDADTQNAETAEADTATEETTDAAEGATQTTAADTPETTETDEAGDTFSRSYVEKLRDENAKLRVRAQGTDELAHRLHTELVRATGTLADPADLAFDPEHLDDTEKLTAAIDELLATKPHLRSRTPKGDVGQGSRGSAETPVNLLQVLKSRV